MSESLSEERQISPAIQRIANSMRGLRLAKDAADYLRDMIKIAEGTGAAYERQTSTFSNPSSVSIHGISVVAGDAVDGLAVGQHVIVDEAGVWAGSVGRISYLTDERAVVDLMDGSPAPSWRAFSRDDLTPVS